MRDVLSFPYYEFPKVSIIISVFNQWKFTQKCLQSIIKNTANISYEVIVIDDNSTDGTKDALKVIDNLVVVYNKENQGFIKNCNFASTFAKGEYLVFLNNDTEVREHWLTFLIETFEDYSDVGVVGAKLVFPDGTLQEAGGVVWSDGSALNYGRGDDPQRPEYNMVREVDYCSGACIAIKKTLWEKVKGFDELYLPAYYEDTDLCFKIRELGFHVIYQPKAEIIHYEGITSGKDVSTGTKAYQPVNQKKFQEKWRNVLEKNHWAADKDLVIRARRHGKKPEVLIVDHWVPEYDKDSGSFRMSNIIEIFKELGFNITFYADSLASQPYTSFFEKMGIEIFSCTEDFRELIEKRKFQFDLFWLARPKVSFPKLHIIRKIFPDAKIVYDTVDLHFLREARRISFTESEFKKNEIKLQVDIFKEEEIFLAKNSDVTVAITDEERKVLNKIDPLLKIEVIPNIHPTKTNSIPSYGQRKDILFIGGYAHPPNIDAVLWFSNNIFPIIRKALGNVTFKIVGSNVTDEVLSLSKIPGIEVIGWLPDLSECLNTARVFVAPLRYGAGMKGKVGEAQSYGLPVVTTSIGAEGMDLEHEKNALIADETIAFANAVISIYNDEQLWEKISAQSIDHVKQYSLENVREILRSTLLKLKNDIKNISQFVRKDVLCLNQVIDDKNKVIWMKKQNVLSYLQSIKNRPVYIWGAGSGGIRTLNLLIELNISVKGFFDSNPNKWNSFIHGLPVLTPSSLEQEVKEIERPYFIIGSIYEKEIKQQLKAYGYLELRDFWTNIFL